MANYKVTSTELGSVANSIRNINNAQDNLVWPEDYNTSLAQIKEEYDSYKRRADQNDVDMEELQGLKTLSETVGINYDSLITFSTEARGTTVQTLFETVERDYKAKEPRMDERAALYPVDEFVIYVSAQITTGNLQSQLLCIPIYNGSAVRSPYRYYNPSTETTPNNSTNRFGVAGVDYGSSTICVHAGDTFVRVVLKNNEK